MKKKEIKLEITLDDKLVPSSIRWNADDSENPTSEAKAFVLSLFDKENKDTMSIDLWTKEMQVNEMDIFMFQTMRGLADTYYKATQNAKIANDFRSFVDYFGVQTGIIKEQK